MERLLKLVLLGGASIGLGLATASAQVILNGNYLRVGVHTSGGLIDDAFTVGISYDQTGTATFPSYDFLRPGAPFEFYSLGYGGSWNAAGYQYGNPFGASTVNTSSGSTLSTLTQGSYNDLGFTQSMWFNVGSGTIDFSVTLTNLGLVALSEVVYARGLDPDQDVFAGGGYETTNTIVNPNLVIGSAPITDWTIGIFSDSAYDHATRVLAYWPFADPYWFLANPGNDGYGDYTINMAWNVGTLAAGASATITFQYRIAETSGEVINPPTHGVPDGASTAALLGLGFVALVGLRLRR
jgi:hypothetical protein